MANTPLISIIVPVYNVERYLPRCIESILRQTYTNFELILVDDGTPDRSGIICDRYAEKDSRIRVIHKENGGVSTARNAGIDAAKGEWITFVDSDDWVYNDYLKVLLEPLNNCDYDLTIAKIESRSITIKPFVRNSFVLCVDEINTDAMLQELYHWEFRGPCVKLFSNQKIKQNQIRFPIGIATGEDDIFVYRYLKHCKKIHMAENVIYCYNRLNDISVTRRNPYFANRHKWDEIYINAIEDVLNEWNVNEEFALNLLSKFVGELFYRNIRLIISSLSKDEAIKKIESVMLTYEKWLLIDCKWAENASRRELVKLIESQNVSGIYDYLMPEKNKSSKIKDLIKKISRGFIEKYRDGLVKFKF